MCAIVGMIGYVPEGRWGETYAVLTEMLKVSECRGTDATGYAALVQPYDNRTQIKVIREKEAIRSTRFVETGAWQQLRHQRSIAVIGHTRMATKGDAKLRINAHPFSGGGFHLVHNGCLTNDEDVVDEFSLRMQSQTDSEVLLRLIEQVGDPLTGLDLCLRRVRGTMAIALLDQRQHLVWLARRDRPLWLCRLRNDRRWWFGSTAEILLEALSAVMGKKVDGQLEYLAPIAEMTPLALTPDGFVLAPSMRLG